MENNDLNYQRMLEQKPLIAFSLYTNIQVETLRRTARGVLEWMDASMTEPGIVDRPIDEVYGSIWLWTLGAYEVVRTMDQAQGCFSPRVTDELKNLKKQLSKLRMPFAKQEYRGRKKPIEGDASFSDVNVEERDLLFTVEGEDISVRGIVKKFDDVFDSIERADILKKHRESYQG